MSANAIYLVVDHIPYGKVATYGQIARLAGLGQGARLVGRTLSQLPADSKLPWHRVVNSRGAISMPAHTTAYDLQKTLLEQEGVVFYRNRVNLAQYGWHPA